ncbi:serpin family protein [Dyadobacter bucti]|uniref:serpin family protein n=1 Tax=Dyadobacter bucti TaxID=2572203 RepID=UPI001109E9BB|nr:serpin family protein [Dyadobacter bucti]
MIKTLKVSFSTLTFIAAALISCTNDTVNPGSNEVTPVEIPSRISDGTTSFAFDFMHNLLETQPAEDNLFVSPLSLHMALGMLLNGAENETSQEILKALKMEGVSIEDLNSAYKTLINNLPVADSKVSLGLANSAWYKSGFQVETDYQNVLKSSFNAEITGLPFDDAGKDRINKWASDKTNGKIKKVLDKISPEHVMFLLNALYFKGDWSYQFDAKNTVDAQFQLENGTTKQVKMMNVKSDFKSASNTTYNAVSLPYANGQFNLTLVIPNGQNTVDKVLKEMTAEEWNTLQSTGLRKAGINVGLPRFTLDYSADLNSTLDNMGIKKVFTGAAELGKINKTADLYVDFIKQDAYLGIDEKGTEAAAVTTIGIGLTSVTPEPPRFICDRPFALIISENTSNTILFMGRIKNPESK